MTYTLGKMKRITDLREVWPHEANDFTKWLAEEQNLSILSESVGCDKQGNIFIGSYGKFEINI